MKRKHISASKLPAEGWSKVDVAGLWANKLFPLLDNSTALQRELELAAARWLDLRPEHLPPVEPWRYSPDCEAPYFMGNFDWPFVDIDEKIARAANLDDPEAQLHEHIVMLIACWTRLGSKLPNLSRPGSARPRKKSTTGSRRNARPMSSGCGRQVRASWRGSSARIRTAI